jgi:hypothetical protein
MHKKTKKKQETNKEHEQMKREKNEQMTTKSSHM